MCVHVCACMCMCVFLTTFKLCSLSFIFSGLTMMWLSIVYLVVFLMVIESLYLKFFLCSNLGNFLYFVKCIFFVPFSLSSPFRALLHFCWTVCYYQIGPKVLFTFFYHFLFVFYTEWFILICVQGNLLFFLSYTLKSSDHVGNFKLQILCFSFIENFI